MITLKDGSEATDPRLTRILQTDSRNLNHPIRALSGGKSERSYTWRCEKVLDQRQEGACVGFALAHEAIARPAEATWVDNEVATKIYWDAQRLDMWEGGEYPDADPQYAGTSVLAGVKAAWQLGFFDEYRWAFDQEDLVLGLGYNGPAVIGVNWYRDMMEPDNNGFIHVNGPMQGGHAILVNGVDVKNRYYKLVNSWGTGWGDKGCCKLSFKDMRKLMKGRGGEAVFLLKRHSR